MAESITVEVACALPGRQVVRKVALPATSTVKNAVAASGIMDAIDFPFDPLQLGIFGKRVAPDAVLKDGDRVELYRPLTLDPKDARRRRARG